LGTFGAGAAPLSATAGAGAAVDVLATGAVVGSADMAFESRIASDQEVKELDEVDIFWSAKVRRVQQGCYNKKKERAL
jgi:hypothetical protein